MKIQKWTVELSNGATLSGNGALLGNSRQDTSDGQVTFLTLNVRQGKTSLNVDLTLPGKVFVTNSGTVVLKDEAKEVEQPAPVAETAPAIAA